MQNENAEETNVDRPPRPRRQRRSTEEVRERILQAASDLFEANGYSGTSTSAIARKARVAEALIFSNFGSKEKLFNASIFKPLNRDLLRFCESHPRDIPQTEMERDAWTREYIESLEAFLDKHSRKFQTLLVHQIYDKPQGELDDIDGIQAYFNLATNLTSQRQKGEYRSEPGMMARLTFGAIFSSVVLRTWLFPRGFAAKNEVFEALREFIVDGLKGNMRGR